MKENVGRFFEIYDTDSSLRERIRQAEAMYPGSLEIREALVRAVLLPEAEKLGLEFTVEELRAYETVKKLRRSSEPDEDLDDFEGYWLLERGWTNDESRFCEGE